MSTKRLIAGLLAGLVLAGWTGQVMAQDSPGGGAEARIQQLERRLHEMAEEVRKLKAAQADKGNPAQQDNHAIAELTKRVEKMESADSSGPGASKFHLGGYGELHANFGEGSAADSFDIHRLVLYLGHDFADWVKFHSEIEVEHAFVAADAGGELALEQVYFDFLLTDAFNFRLGRVLTPLGIINKKHEPPAFNGVERPLFDRFIIPTTWSSDGVGIFGSLTPSLKYEAYVVAGLDGSKFDAANGIRDGRIAERPSLHEPGFTGRLDYYPLAERAVPLDQTLRWGLSSYLGGLDNGNKGVNPGVAGSLQVYSSDVEYSLWKFDVRGAVAYEIINGARAIGNGTASAIFGWNLEGAYHFWPDSWKTGRLDRSDAVVFVRCDDVNTQYRMPSGIAANLAGDRREWTLGLGFYPTPNVVIKADYQFRDDASRQSLPGAFNLGIGFQF